MKRRLGSTFTMHRSHAASGHNLYTKCARIYLQEMKKLQKDEFLVCTAFKNGFHVIRRSDHFWAGWVLDLVIESVLMKSLKATCRLTQGRGMSETQRLVWLLSIPITAEVNNAMQQLTEVDYTTSEQHKDMSDSRIKRDMKDTKTILEFIGASEDSCVSYIIKKYNKGVVVFDGYEHGSAPKDVTHYR